MGKWERERDARRTFPLSHPPTFPPAHFQFEPPYVGCCEIERAGSIALPAHAISTKNKHLLVIYSIPARGFTAAVSVFRGTPPPKPLKCKSVSNHPGARLRSRWAEPTDGKPRLSRAIFSFATTDIIETSFCYRSQLFTFRCRRSPSVSGK